MCKKRGKKWRLLDMAVEAFLRYFTKHILRNIETHTRTHSLASLLLGQISRRKVAANFSWFFFFLTRGTVPELLHHSGVCLVRKGAAWEHENMPVMLIAFQIYNLILLPAWLLWKPSPCCARELGPTDPSQCVGFSGADPEAAWACCGKDSDYIFPLPPPPSLMQLLVTPAAFP